MAKTLKDLLLALLNATLILVALCLFLGWKLASSVEGISANFSDIIQVVAPLRDEAQGIRGELTALRSELAALPTDGSALDTATTQRISMTLNRLDAIEDSLKSAQTQFSDLAEEPDVLVETAITTAGDVITEKVLAIRGCVPEV
ncbi:hypothetical protein ABLN87_01035 [Ruegeria sp. SCPT10]|uniref:hypothetical protein n=1 Tax=Ruegeria sp. SCP10 TaxID=3141377 RepID=UPI00333705D1